MPTAKTSHVVSCMHGSSADFNAEGGAAIVHWLPDVPVKQCAMIAEQMLAAQAADKTTSAEQNRVDAGTQGLVSVFVAGAEGRYIAESYTLQGLRIQFCGHGALAAAWVVFHEYAPDAEKLEFSNANRSWQARRVGSSLPGKLATKSSQDSSGASANHPADKSVDEIVPADISLRYTEPHPVNCAVPDFAATALGAEPIAAAKSGTPSDYLILEMSDADSVQRLQPDFAAITAATKRALIVTARSTHAGQPACVFRYFAPQYGNPEDAATGSAAVQLAAYWPARLQRDHFTALQLSKQGALLQLACAGGKVDLAARVRYR